MRENDLVNWAVAWLRERLPETWKIEPTRRSEFQGLDGSQPDAALDLQGPSGTYATIVIEAKRSFGPRGVNQLLGPVGRTLRALSSQVPILVVSDWLSERTRELLAEQGLNYIDLTGNALVRLDNPTLYLQTQGASRNPTPPERSPARLQGPKAGRLIRALADICPPYGVRELAAAAEITPGYTSRLVQTLDSDALVDRDQHGRILTVDVPRVLRRWTQNYDVFRSNATMWCLARGGANDIVDRLRTTPQRTAVTGSFAASRLAPVAAARLLVVYAEAPAELLGSLDLLPADEGANVAVLQPVDDVVWKRTTQDEGLTYVAASQAAADCLTGNGRMPSEGEALLEWMTENEDKWRLQKLPSRDRSSP